MLACIVHSGPGAAARSAEQAQAIGEIERVGGVSGRGQLLWEGVVFHWLDLVRGHHPIRAPATPVYPMRS
jgi:hypothetical protein